MGHICMHVPSNGRFRGGRPLPRFKGKLLSLPLDSRLTGRLLPELLSPPPPPPSPQDQPPPLRSGGFSSFLRESCSSSSSSSPSSSFMPGAAVSVSMYVRHAYHKMSGAIQTGNNWRVCAIATTPRTNPPHIPDSLVEHTARACDWEERKCVMRVKIPTLAPPKTKLGVSKARMRGRRAVFEHSPVPPRLPHRSHGLPLGPQAPFPPLPYVCVCVYIYIRKNVSTRIRVCTSRVTMSKGSPSRLPMSSSSRRGDLAAHLGADVWKAKLRLFFLGLSNPLEGYRFSGNCFACYRTNCAHWG